jgi:hypothetical protein
MNEVITRTVAKRQSLKTYFTGKPCKYGHVSPRRTDNGLCIECANEKSLKLYHSKYKNDPSYVSRVKAYNKKRNKIIGTKWHHENKERAAANNKAYREANPDIVKKSRDSFRKRHAAKVLAECNKRNADKKNRTPKWADHKAIQSFYEEAIRLTKITGIPHHVDHIVPLVGHSVSGLHCEHNLQVITAEENIKKNNKFEI